MNSTDHTLRMFVNSNGDGKMPTTSNPEA